MCVGTVVPVRSYGSTAYRLRDDYHTRLAVSSDGRTVFAVGRPTRDGAVLQSVDVAIGTVVEGDAVDAFTVAGDAVVAVPTADPTSLTVAGADLAVERTVRLDTRVRCLAAGGPVVVAAGSGPVVVAAGDGPPTVAVVDPVTGAVRSGPLPAPPTCVAVSDDGTVAAIGTGTERSGSVLLVDTATATVTATLKGPRAPVGSVRVSGTGLVVAAAGPRVLGWTPGVPKAVTLLVGRKPVSVVGFTTGGLLLAQVREKSLHAIDPATAAEVWTVDQYDFARVHGDRVLSLHFHTVRELDPATGAVRRSWTSRNFTHGLAVGPGVVAATPATGRVAVLRDGEPWPEDPGGHGARVIAVSFAGERFATSGRDVRVCVWQRGSSTPVFTAEPVKSQTESEAVHLDDDAVWTAFGTRMQRYPLDGGPAVTTGYLKDQVTVIRPLPGTGLVLAAAQARRRSYGELYLFDATTLTPVHSERTVSTFRRADLRDDGLVELRGDANLSVFDPATRTVVHQRTVRGRAIGPTRFLLPGAALLVETEYRGRIHVIDPDRNERLYDVVETVPFSGTGALSDTGVLATVHKDAVRLWDAHTGEPVETLAAPDGVRQVWFTPDGKALLATFGDGRLVELD
jgi:WD40 repeat protein